MDQFSQNSIIFILGISSLNLLGWVYFAFFRNKKQSSKESELEIQLVQNKLKEAISALEQKNMMVKVLTHDISNCLIPLTFFAKLIGKKKVEELNQEEFERAINRIEISTNRISSMVVQVRNFETMVSRASNDRLKFVSLDQCLSDALLLFKDQFKQKNISYDIRFHLPITNQVKVLVEPASFVNSFLNNLIRNSLKFSFQNGVIEIDILKSTNDMIEISFTDRGVGMSEETMKNIFSFKHNTSKDGTSGEKGTGFGMPILKKYIEIYEGDISVNSIEKTETSDGYTCFKILLKSQL